MNKQKRTKTGMLGILLIAATLIGMLPQQPLLAAVKTETVTVGTFDRKLKHITGAKESFLKGSESAKSGQSITNEYAAVLLNRADTYMNGSAYNTTLYKKIIRGKRISDIAKVTKSYQKAVRLVFLKGIMPGESNGAYSQSRRFFPKHKLTQSEVSTALNRLRSKTKRVKLSYDGQVIRTTNLPKNYKKYPYILASFPNSFYEHKFQYQFTTRGDGQKLKEGRDYCSPVYLLKKRDYYGVPMKTIMNQYSEHLHDLIYKNLSYRFNYNYKTTNDAKWISNMKSTYYHYTYNDDNQKTVRSLRNYISYAKKWGVVVQARDIVVEPSTMYSDFGVGGNGFIRCRATIKVTAKDFQTAESGDQNGMIYAGGGDYATYIPGLKNGQWYTFDFDIYVGPHAYNDQIKDWGVWDLPMNFLAPCDRV